MDRSSILLGAAKMAIADDFKIDYLTKTIKFELVSARRYTFPQIWEYLKNAEEDEEIGPEEAKLKYLLK